MSDFSHAMSVVPVPPNGSITDLTKSILSIIHDGNDTGNPALCSLAYSLPELFSVSMTLGNLPCHEHGNDLDLPSAPNANTYSHLQPNVPLLMCGGYCRLFQTRMSFKLSMCLY